MNASGPTAGMERLEFQFNSSNRIILFGPCVCGIGSTFCVVVPAYLPGICSSTSHTQPLVSPV